MQMFEDAISRWRHSKTCKGSAKLNREKDLNGQVGDFYRELCQVFSLPLLTINIGSCSQWQKVCVFFPKFRGEY